MPFGEKLYVNTHLKHHIIACLLSSVKYSPLYRNKNVKISVQLSVWFSTDRRIYATYVDINITDINFAIYQVGDMSLIPELGRYPGEVKWQPTTVFLPGKSHE